MADDFPSRLDDGKMSPSLVDGILGFLQPREDAGLSEKGNPRQPIFIMALCPYCGMNCQQIVIEELLFRKRKHQCTACHHDTCPCDNFENGCGGAAKSFPLWDDGLCVLCSMERPGNDDWIGNIVQQLSPQKGREAAEQFVPTTPRVVSDEYLSSVHKDNIHGREDATHRADAPLSMDSTEMEDWVVVRDALLAWGGEEKHDVMPARHCLARKAFVQRWLRASKYDLVDTAAKLLQHCTWRREYGVDGISEEDWSAFDARGEMYVSGVDLHGRPSCTWRVCLHDSSFGTPEKYTRYLVTIVERTRAVNPDAGKINFILDCSGLSFSNYDHAMFLLCARAVQDNYPDNVEHIFILPVGWLFHSILAIARPFLHEDTLAKMSFMTDSEIQAEMLRHFAHDQLEDRLGGALTLSEAAARIDFATVLSPHPPDPPHPLPPRVQQLQQDLAARLGSGMPSGTGGQPATVTKTVTGANTDGLKCRRGAPGKPQAHSSEPDCGSSEVDAAHDASSPARSASASAPQSSPTARGAAGQVESSRASGHRAPPIVDMHSLPARGVLPLLFSAFSAQWWPLQGLRSLFQRVVSFVRARGDI